ncbi:MAG: prolyl oligopeptidase family serine peptidase, partial [Pseudomonadota bacterium]
PAWLTGLRDNIMFDAPALRFEYESMTTPATVFDYDLTTHERTEVWQDTVLGDFDPSNYEMRQHHVTARDGTRVPVSIVARRDRAPDHKRPLLLYGYGAYGITIDPNFSLTRLSLLDRGFAMAIAHVRGGEYLGREWYEQGRQRNKYNSFNDFIDVATWLRDQQLCAPDALYAMGGSAGGLLMGVVINDAPELFAGVVAKVPFVDVVTTMLDDQLPLTTGEYDEWGDPNNADTYHFLLRYSPYDNIREQRYPNLLITAGLHDSQVQYFEPAKWVARLRERSTGDALLMLKTEMDAGHSGASGRFESLHEIAREYAFLIGLADEAGALPPGMGV